MNNNLSRTLIAALMAATANVAVITTPPAAHPEAEVQQAEQSESMRLYGWFDEVFNEDLNDSPLTLTFFGRKDRNHEIDDFSDQKAQKDHETTKQRLTYLATFDFDALSEEARLSYRLFELQLERSIEGFEFRFHNYPINQFFGWHMPLPLENARI